MRKVPASRPSGSPPTDKQRPEIASPGRRLSAILTALCLATLVAYARTLLQGFVDFNDDKNFYLNPHLNPIPDLNVLHYFRHPYFHEFRQAIALSPDTAFRYDNLGKALQGEGRLSEALSGEQTAARIDPFLVPAFAKSAEIALLQGDTATAVENDLKTSRLDPDNVPAYDGLSQAYLRQGNRDQAIQALQDALTRNPNYAPARLHLRAILKVH